MEQSTLAIDEIYQENSDCFSIVWNTKERSYLRAFDIQRSCPCTECRDEKTGKFIKEISEMDKKVKPIKIKSVGNYGLRILFTTGCSKGIYPFTLLKKIGEESR